MPRRLALLLGAVSLLSFLSLLSFWPPPARAIAEETRFVGPTRILLADGDSVLYVVSRDWLSASVRHQEKLLRYAVRMAYWRDHIPEDMRMVFDELGYPTSRVLLTPTGHTEEWWYYGPLAPPLRFRDGQLIDNDRFESLLGE